MKGDTKLNCSTIGSIIMESTGQRRSLRIKNHLYVLDSPGKKSKVPALPRRRSLRLIKRDGSAHLQQSNKLALLFPTYSFKMSCCGVDFPNQVLWFKHQIIEHIMNQKLAPFTCEFCERVNNPFYIKFRNVKPIEVIHDKELYVLHRYVLNVCHDPMVYSLHRPGMYDSCLSYPPPHLNFVGTRKHMR